MHKQPSDQRTSTPCSEKVYLVDLLLLVGLACSEENKLTSCSTLQHECMASGDILVIQYHVKFIHRPQRAQLAEGEERTTQNRSSDEHFRLMIDSVRETRELRENNCSFFCLGVIISDDFHYQSIKVLLSGVPVWRYPVPFRPA